MGMTTGERLLALADRVERLERLSYLSYVELRKLAEYTYQLTQLPEGTEVKRIKELRKLTDNDALKWGMEFDDLVALKFKMRVMSARCRADVLAIAQDLADERKRHPAVPVEEPAQEAEAS